MKKPNTGSVSVDANLIGYKAGMDIDRSEDECPEYASVALRKAWIAGFREGRESLRESVEYDMRHAERRQRA